MKSKTGNLTARLSLLLGIVPLGFVLLIPPGVEADVLAKSMRRRLPQDWFTIPQTRFDLTFRATGPDATIRLTVSDVTIANELLQIDNIAIVKREYYRAHQVFDATSAMEKWSSNSRVPGSNPGSSADRCCESHLDFPDTLTECPGDPGCPSAADLPFLDTFGNSPAGTWTGVDGVRVMWKASFGSKPDTFPGGNGLALEFTPGTPTTVSFSVGNLVTGATYLLTGWWRIGSTSGGPPLPTIDVEIGVAAGDDVQSQPPILVVDDDDVANDVRQHYTAALDELGLSYEIWDPGTGQYPAFVTPPCSPAPTDCDPDSATLSRYSTILWFTGRKWLRDGGPGPGPAGPTPGTGEDALSGFLAQGGCLVLSSQDYFWEQAETTLMTSYLGVAATGSAGEVTQTKVAGENFFGGLGSEMCGGVACYTVDPPFQNFSDQLSPGSGFSAFSGQTCDFGPCGDAAIYNEVFAAPDYRTVYFGFPLTGLIPQPPQPPQPDDFQDVLARSLKLCDLTCPSDKPYRLRLQAASGQPNLAIEDNQIACSRLDAERITIQDTSGTSGQPVKLTAENVVSLGEGFQMEPNAELIIELTSADGPN